MIEKGEMLVKSFKKIILGSLLVVDAVCAITSWFIGGDFECSGRDLMLYRLSGFMLFAVLLLGLMVELNLFKIREKVKFLSLNSLKKQIIFWIIVFVAGIGLFLITEEFTSADFQTKMEISIKQKNEQKRLEKEKKKEEESRQKESQRKKEEESRKKEEEKKQEESKKKEEQRKKEEESKQKAEKKKKEEESKRIALQRKKAAEEQRKKLNSIYGDLSDKDFTTLTNLVAKSFYSHKLNNENQNLVNKNKDINKCLKTIYQYADKHYLKIDPAYQKAFSVRFALVKKASKYKLLKNRFKVSENKDGASIKSYTVNSDDVIEYGGVKYIDADGYLAKGINFYWKEDGGMEKAGTIKDIKYNKVINGIACEYAIKVEYVDDPMGAYWKDGISFLRSAKITGGDTEYYVALFDSKRPIKKEDLD